MVDLYCWEHILLEYLVILHLLQLQHLNLSACLVVARGREVRGERVEERVEEERIAPTLHGVYLGELKKELEEDFKIFFLIILETKKVLVIILLLSPPKTLS